MWHSLPTPVSLASTLLLDYLLFAWNLIQKAYAAVIPRRAPDVVPSTAAGAGGNAQVQVVGLSVPAGSAGTIASPSPGASSKQSGITASGQIDDDWSLETDPNRRRRIQNKLAQRKFRERAKTEKEDRQRDCENRERASYVYSTSSPSDLDDRDNLDGVPWGSFCLGPAFEEKLSDQSPLAEKLPGKPPLAIPTTLDLWASRLDAAHSSLAPLPGSSLRRYSSSKNILSGSRLGLTTPHVSPLGCYPLPSHYGPASNYYGPLENDVYRSWLSEFGDIAGSDQYPLMSAGLPDGLTTSRFPMPAGSAQGNGDTKKLEMSIVDNPECISTRDDSKVESQRSFATTSPPVTTAQPNPAPATLEPIIPEGAGCSKRDAFACGNCDKRFPRRCELR